MKDTWILDPDGGTLTAPDGAIYRMPFEFWTRSSYLAWVYEETKTYYVRLGSQRSVGTDEVEGAAPTSIGVSSDERGKGVG